MHFGTINHYKVSKEKDILLIIAFLGEDETDDYHRVQIKLADLPIVLETLKNIDHDPSEEGEVDELMGRVLNDLISKEDENYMFWIRTEYDPWGYHDPKNLWIFSYWNDKSIKSNRICISYWTYEELKTEVDRLVDAIEEAMKN